MKDKFFFNDEWDLLLDYKGNLNFNRLNFCLVNEYLLIFNTISVSFNRHFLYNLYRYSFLNLNLDVFLLSYQPLHYFLHIDCLDLLLFA